MERVKRIKLKDRILPTYTKGEEIFNMVSHIAGGVFGIVALVLCVIIAAINRDVWGVVSGAIYGTTMIVLYTMSSIYHGLKPNGMAKKVFQVIDHCSIFFLISGTYTPITLCTVREANPILGWVIFGIVWGMAILGCVLNAIDLKKYKKFSMICYLGMGWCIVAAAKPMLEILATGAIWLLLAGGIVYTIGAILYGCGKKMKYMHSIFHLFVVAGSILHFFCIALYILK